VPPIPVPPTGPQPSCTPEGHSAAAAQDSSGGGIRWGPPPGATTCGGCAGGDWEVPEEEWGEPHDPTRGPPKAGEGCGAGSGGWCSRRVPGLLYDLACHDLDCSHVVVVGHSHWQQGRLLSHAHCSCCPVPPLSLQATVTCA
jgi:hypothetical protein